MSDPVLVIGGGVAGMTAAVELADSGISTVLVERGASLGGNALDLYKAFPTDDCFYCFEGNRWKPGIRKCFYRSTMLDQPGVDLRTGSTVESITGTAGRFEAKIRSDPMYVDPRKCIMCGICLERSKAFSLVSPQCQPQAVIYNPRAKDAGSDKAETDCPTRAINLHAEEKSEVVRVSDVVVTTGYREMRPVAVDEYGYGKIADVITQLEMAKIMDPNGPSQGALVRPSDGAPAKRVIMVQCVGSRDEKFNPYCSKICCVFALKHANIAVTERNCTDVTVVYMDIRTYDRHERYYRDARNAGVDFVRGRVQRVSPTPGGGVTVIVYDSLLNRYLSFVVDLLVLSSALEPSEGASKIMESLSLKSASGFVAPLNPASENEVVVGDHIYACGTALGPAELPESVTQARAVVSKILQSRR